MLRGYQEAMLAINEAANRGEPMSGQAISDLVGKLMEEFDDNPDDDLGQPAYKCRPCQDSGFQSHEDRSGRKFAGHCDCEAGLARKAAYEANGRSLGRGGIGKVVVWDVE
jgi:hypothetical protein